ncbi:helix-turn-helix domain-containing protein [Streptomyces sp. MN03-5084-2B]|nr:helix-turn-helix domain-containing protein [Streptomyces sp. MN03-5084-2B]
MMTVIRTADYPVGERFERWRELVSHKVTTPVEFICEDPHSYHGAMRGAPFGEAFVSSTVCSPCQVLRSGRMIRRSDPEVVHVMAVERGEAGVDQTSTTSVCPSGNLVVYGSWRPYEIIDIGDEVNVVKGAATTIPYSQIPLPRDSLERLFATPFSSKSGLSGLLARFITGLAGDIETYQIADSVRLGGILVDLLSAFIASVSDITSALPSDAREQALLAHAQDFIRQHLGDPALTPAMVAAAHHISVRSLQRLFQKHGHTVVSWIRHQRLEHCRRDLIGSGSQIRPVHAIAMRWGFTDPAHFSRVFRAAYGLPPGEYRFRGAEATNMSRSVNP